MVGAYLLPFGTYISPPKGLVGYFSILGNGVFYIVSWDIFFWKLSDYWWNKDCIAILLWHTLCRNSCDTFVSMKSINFRVSAVYIAFIALHVWKVVCPAQLIAELTEIFMLKSGICNYLFCPQTFKENQRSELIMVVKMLKFFERWVDLLRMMRVYMRLEENSYSL